MRRLIEKAASLAVPMKLTADCTIAGVGAALVTDKGNVYTGVSIDCGCGIGFCAEHSAVASMLSNRESRISMVVAVRSGGQVLPPCGRCRELMYQVNWENKQTKVAIDLNKIVRLGRLLPTRFQDV